MRHVVCALRFKDAGQFIRGQTRGENRVFLPIIGQAGAQGSAEHQTGRITKDPASFRSTAAPPCRDIGHHQLAAQQAQRKLGHEGHQGAGFKDAGPKAVDHGQPLIA